MGLNIALKAFWHALTNGEVADRFSAILDRGCGEKDDSLSPVIIASDLPKSSLQGCGDVRTERLGKDRSSERSEALELLATLQREARFVDFIEESLEGCDDAVLGAAARSVHDRCKATLERLFEIRPISEVREGENTLLSLEEIRDSSRFQVSSGMGNKEANGRHDEKVSVKITHSGWRVSKCSLPKWSGVEADIEILAPVEIELLR